MNDDKHLLRDLHTERQQVVGVDEAREDCLQTVEQILVTDELLYGV